MMKMAELSTMSQLISKIFVAYMIFFLSPGIEAIRIEYVKVPARVQTGQTVTLYCHYDMEGKSLYSLNWWRGSEQFYEFSPTNSDPITVYDTPGISVDTTKSGGNAVVLKNVSQASAGKFKCEVLAEYPSFEKDSEVAHMEVIDVPNRDPSLLLNRRQWSPGEVLMANCSFPGAKPSPHLQWYINSDQISSNQSQLIVPKRQDHYSGLLMSDPSLEQIKISQLMLELKQNHFTPAGSATLSCVAYLPELYRKQADVMFTMPGFRAAAPSQKFYGSGYPPKVQSMALVVLGTLIGIIL